METIDIAKSGKYLVGGYSLGHVTFWDLQTFEDVKNILDVFLNPVKIVRCLPGPRFGCLSCESSGMMIKLDIIQQYFISKVQKSMIFNRGESKPH